MHNTIIDIIIENNVNATKVLKEKEEKKIKVKRVIHGLNGNTKIQTQEGDVIEKR